MSSRCRAEVLVLAALLLAAGCERERREYHSAPETADAHPRLTPFQPGTATPEPVARIGAHYERNAYHISQGGMLYRQFNCVGCHGAGGGSIGPALMDDQWRYGGRIDQIHATILEGRPNGMPSWRGKLTDVQAWQLAAYVRALSGNVPKDAAPGRRDAMTGTLPPVQMPEQPVDRSDPSALRPPPP